jgi:hypothetical protein
LDAPPLVRGPLAGLLLALGGAPAGVLPEAALAIA